MTAKEETHLLSGAYALDAVTAEEAAAVEAEMLGSEELRGEIVGLIDTAVTLGLALPAATPPPALRASLLASLDGVPQLPAEEEPREPAVVSSPVRSEAHVAPRRRRRMRRPVLLLTAAMAAVLLFGGGVLVRSAIVEPQLEYSRILAAPDHQTRDAQVAGGGTATVIWSTSLNAMSVSLDGVRVPSGRVLQLWRVTGDTVSSAGLYEGGADAQYELIHRVPAAGERLAVSIEPAGGSKQPTTAPIVDVPLAA